MSGLYSKSYMEALESDIYDCITKHPSTRPLYYELKEMPNEELEKNIEEHKNYVEKNWFLKLVYIIKNWSNK